LKDFPPIPTGEAVINAFAMFEKENRLDPLGDGLALTTAAHRKIWFCTDSDIE